MTYLRSSMRKNNETPFETHRTHDPLSGDRSQLPAIASNDGDSRNAGLPILRTSMITMNFINAATLALDAAFALRQQSTGR